MKSKLITFGKWFVCIFVALAIIGELGTLGSSTPPLPNAPTPTSVAQPLTQDPALVADAQELGINYTPLNWRYSSSVLTSNTETSDGTVVGLFTTPNSIQIATGLSKSDELNMVAYEYMHYYWSNLTEYQRQSIGANLDEYRTQNADFNADVSRYHGDVETIQDEEDSTACTRVASYLLSDDFNAYCNTAIPNRSILFE